MPNRYLSPAMHEQDAQSISIAPLIGIEAKIYGNLWDAIIDRKLRPGVKLEEATLCEIYGISRTVIRKVLVVMEQEGIIALPVNRGAYVATPSPRDAIELQDMVYALIGYVAGKLAADPARITAEQRRRIALHLEAEKAAKAALEFASMRRLRIEFGTLLGLIYGSRVFAATIERHTTRFALALATYQQVPTPDGDAFSSTVVKHIYDGNRDELATYLATIGMSVLKTLSFNQDEAIDLKAILRG